MVSIKDFECGDLVRILLYKSDLVGYVWDNDRLEKEFGLKGKIVGLEDVDIIFSSLNPMGVTFDDFTDNLQLFGVYQQGHYLKVLINKGKSITFDEPIMSVHGYQLIKRHEAHYDFPLSKM